MDRKIGTHEATILRYLKFVNDLMRSPAVLRERVELSRLIQAKALKASVSTIPPPQLVKVVSILSYFSLFVQGHRGKRE